MRPPDYGKMFSTWFGGVELTLILIGYPTDNVASLIDRSGTAYTLPRDRIKSTGEVMAEALVKRIEALKGGGIMKREIGWIYEVDDTSRAPVMCTKTQGFYEWLTVPTRRSFIGKDGVKRTATYDSEKDTFILDKSEL